MSFWTGFTTGLASSIDKGLQSAIQKRDGELSAAKKFWMQRDATKREKYEAKKEKEDAEAVAGYKSLLDGFNGNADMAKAAFDSLAASGGGVAGVTDYLSKVRQRTDELGSYDISLDFKDFKAGDTAYTGGEEGLLMPEYKGTPFKAASYGVGSSRLDELFGRTGADTDTARLEKQMNVGFDAQPAAAAPAASTGAFGSVDRSRLSAAQKYKEDTEDRAMKLDRFEMDKSAFKQNQSKVTQAMQIAREAEDRLKADQDNDILQQEYQNAVDAADRYKRYAQLDREAEMFILKKEAAELGIEVTQLQLDKDRKPPEFTDFEKMAVYYTQKLGERGLTTEQKNDYAEGLRRAVDGASKWNAATVKKDGKSKFFSNESRQSILNGEIKRQLEPFGMVDDLGQVIEEEIDGTDQPKYFDSMRRALDNVTSQVAGLNDPSMNALIAGQRSSLRAKMNEYKKSVVVEQQKFARNRTESLSDAFKETLEPGDVVTYETDNGGTATRIWTGDRYI
jgi:hypothetical protein